MLILKKRLTLRDRIIEILNAHGGRYYGMRDLVTEAETSTSALRYALRRLNEFGKVNITPGSAGRGNKTIVELTQ